MKKVNQPLARFDVGERGSATIHALESAWELLRSVESSIPPAVLTLVDARSRRQVLGYFARSIWKKRRGKAHEIALSPELIGFPKELLATMLHEAAHAILHESGQRGGVSGDGYYHLAIFRDQCESLGLECEFWNTRYGFTVTHWPTSGVPRRYRPIIRLLKQSLPAGIGAQPQKKVAGRPLPVPGHTPLTCGCSEANRTVYVKKTVLNAGGVTCAFCGQEFRVARK